MLYLHQKVLPIHDYVIRPHLDGFGSFQFNTMPNLPPPTKKPKPERGRQKSRKDYDTSAWKRATHLYRMEHPLCEVCQYVGLITDASPGNRKGVTDHLVRLSVGGAKADSRNLCTMCESCHNRKRLQERNGWTPAHIGSTGARVPLSRIEIVAHIASSHPAVKAEQEGGGTLTAMDALNMFGCWNMKARVNEIRQALQEEGNQFVVITEMIPVSPKKRVARYRIEKKQTQ